MSRERCCSLEIMSIIVFLWRIKLNWIVSEWNRMNRDNFSRTSNRFRLFFEQLTVMMFKSWIKSHTNENRIGSVANAIIAVHLRETVVQSVNIHCIKMANVYPIGDVVLNGNLWNNVYHSIILFANLKFAPLYYFSVYVFSTCFRSRYIRCFWGMLTQDFVAPFQTKRCVRKSYNFWYFFWLNETKSWFNLKYGFIRLSRLVWVTSNVEYARTSFLTLNRHFLLWSRSFWWDIEDPGDPFKVKNGEMIL